MTHNQSMRRGQALIIILLILAVITTIGLSVASRSVTEVSTSVTSDEGTRALSAAESGVEYALSMGSGGVNSDIGYTVTVESQNSSAQVILTDKLKAGEIGTVFLAPHSSNGMLDTTSTYNGNKFNVCWGKSGTPNDNSAPAIEVDLYYFEENVYKISRLAYDPNSSRITSSNNNFSTLSSGFNISSDCPSGSAFAFGTQIGLNANGFGVSTNNLLFLQIRPFYNGDVAHVVGVKNGTGGGGDSFPAQGTIITSTGTAGVSTKKVQVLQTYGAPYSIFTSAVFSGSDLVK
ncbi:MAG: hypothetical protein UU93_C0006G0009 [Candidatus Amesbacteria bacterium GW2011_GWA2_42_12]|uniref:Type 4 fimbrial biogenesis protein PilX N-terminal domain-containing protein n=1 Tax=Candidatus Amesbacteria bacterium GW2011_GWA2_42_12 TaxID=1618356 RepID=A0A0G0Y705_9BACT|nr:MAG: hypothetical protein UU93_C0006G0009 [Candidatus Amesbacteria bacterium GW2011_GWA2_42_12]